MEESPKEGLTARIKEKIAEGTWLFFNKAWILLGIIIVQLIITPFILYRHICSSMPECIQISLWTFVGDSLADVGMNYATVSVVPLIATYALRFAGWLILPIIVAILIQQGQEVSIRTEKAKRDIEEQTLRLAEESLRTEKAKRDIEEQTLRLTEESLNALKESYRDLGFDDDDATEAAKSVRETFRRIVEGE